MINYVKTISTSIDSAKKRIVKFLRLGLHDVQTAFEAAPFGIDSNVPKDFIAIYAATGEKGSTIIIGYINKNQLSEVGETRIYSTSTDGKDLKFYVYCKNDGTAEIGGDVDNMVRYSKLKEEYDKTKEVLDIFLQTLQTPINEPGNGAPSAFQAALLGALSGKATGDIASCKIDEIKTL